MAMSTYNPHFNLGKITLRHPHTLVSRLYNSSPSMTEIWLHFPDVRMIFLTASPPNRAIPPCLSFVVQIVEGITTTLEAVKAMTK